MSVNTTSGLVALFKRARQYFLDNEVPASIHLGWQSRYRITNQGTPGANRVVFTPGDDNGAGGRIVATRSPGARYVGGSSQDTATDAIRPLYDWERYFIISVWGRDDTATGDEEAREVSHVEVVEDLLEWVIRAIHHAGHADIVPSNVTWTPPAERAYGVEARMGVTFRHPFFDVADDVVRPQAAIAKHLISP